MSANDDKTYLITGASSGIGLELAKQLAAQGKNVFCTVRSKKSSMTGVDLLSSVAESGNVTIIEGIDVSDDGVGEILIDALKSSSSFEKIDVVVHNAGSINGTRDLKDDVMGAQKLEVVTMDVMRAAFEVNTLGPLRVQQALLKGKLMKENGGKVGIISTGLSSIQDNTSGGNYAYRASKTAVNMIARCLSCDLKESGISVMAIAPGFVATEFGPGKEKMTSWGAMPVDVSAKGIISLLDKLDMESTGTFHSVQRDSTSKEFPW